MKKLITDDIQGTVGAPLTAPALDALQENFKDVPHAIVTGLIQSYTPNDLIVLHGVVVSISTTDAPNDTATWTAGAIDYNGETYLVSAGSLVKTTGVFLYKVNAAVVQETFDDGLNHDWIGTDTITIIAGTSGTGIADVGSGTVKRLYDRMISLLGLTEVALTAPSIQTGWVSSVVGGQDGLRYEKKGKLVHLRGGVKRTTGGTALIATLPSGFRPASVLYRSAVCIDAGSSFVVKTVLLQDDGDLLIDSTGSISTDDTLCIDFMYFID